MQLCVSIPYISFCLFMSLPLSMTLPLLCNPNTPRAQSLTGHGTFALLYMSCNGHHTMLQNEAMWHCMHYMYYYRCAFTVHGVTYTPHSPTHEFPRALYMVTNTIVKHKSHRTIALCGNISILLEESCNNC